MQMTLHAALNARALSCSKQADAHLGRGGEDGLDSALAAEPQRRNTA